MAAGQKLVKNERIIEKRKIKIKRNKTEGLNISYLLCESKCVSWYFGFRKFKILTAKNQTSKLLNTGNYSFIIYKILKKNVFCVDNFF